MTDSSGRDSDPPGYRDLQAHLTKLDDHLLELRNDFNAERVKTAERFSAVREAISERGRFPVGAWIAFAGLALTIVAGGSGIYAELKESSGIAHKALALIEQHVATAGPFREGVARWQRDMEEMDTIVRRLDKQAALNVQRLDAIEARNKVADANWEKVRSKGLLVDSTGVKQ